MLAVVLCLAALSVLFWQASHGCFPVLVLWQRGNHAMAKQLVAAKVDTTVIDRCGRTAMDVAFDAEMRIALEPPPPAEEEEGE